MGIGVNLKAKLRRIGGSWEEKERGDELYMFTRVM